MPCSYSGCVFKRNLSDVQRDSICDICHIKRYAKGQFLRESYWANSVTMVLEGLMLEVEQRAGEQTSVTALNSVGSFLNLGDLFGGIDGCGIDDFKDTYCATNCAVAVIRSSELAEQMRADPEIEHALLKHCVLRTIPERRELLLNLGFGDAKTSIRYVLEYLKRYGIAYLTHEQIALICHRSRQTVTSTIKQLQREEPNLFSRD